MSRVVLLTVALLLPALAGCLNRENPAGAQAPEGAAPEGAAPDAEDATRTGVAGAPVAPTTAFSVEADGERRSIHPYVVPGQEAREGVSTQVAGEFAAQDCKGPASWLVEEGNDFFDLTEHVRPGDAVQATVALTFVKPTADPLELHLFTGAPGQGLYWEEPVGDATGEVVQEFVYQFSFPPGGDASFYAGVDCWESWATETVAYTIDVTLVFAEGVVPAGTPLLVPVSANVTELLVSGAPFVAGSAVLGHYRLFAPDDSLVGEFALNSDEAYDAVPVPTPGDYVIIVDHSEGGMLALGADAAPADSDLTVLASDWRSGLVWESASPGPASATVTIDVPRVPLFIAPWSVAHEDSVGGGKKLVIDLDSPKGRVWHRQYAGELGVDAAGFGFETGVPGVVDEWRFEYDHHALALGAQTFTISAELYHGQVWFGYVSYVRPGESGVPIPAGGAAEALPTVGLKSPVALRAA